MTRDTNLADMNAHIPADKFTSRWHGHNTLLSFGFADEDKNTAIIVVLNTESKGYG